LRFVLGLIEAGFFVSSTTFLLTPVFLTAYSQPGVLLYMSFWYKKMELARRFSVFYSASLVSGAFGGLLGRSPL
jgi:hypothetical protein